MITAEGHRHREARDPKLARRIAAHIVWLRQELAGVECDLDDAVKASPAWRANEELLTSVPGVVTPRRAPRSPSCLSWAASTAPSSQPWSAWRRSTGTAAPCAGRRVVQGGRNSIRAVLCMAALVAARRNAPVRALYLRLRAAGRPAKVALTACMRKLFTILNSHPPHPSALENGLTGKTVTSLS